MTPPNEKSNQTSHKHTVYRVPPAKHLSTWLLPSVVLLCSVHSQWRSQELYGGGVSDRVGGYTKSGGGTVHFRPIYEKWRGGGGGRGDSPLQADIRKVGGGGAVHFRSDTFVWHTENTSSLIINGYTILTKGGAQW